jgi:hypothetical protein
MLAMTGAASALMRPLNNERYDTGLPLSIQTRKKVFIRPLNFSTKFPCLARVRVPSHCKPRRFGVRGIIGEDKMLICT